MSTETKQPARVWTIGIGGAAGDGVREAGIHLGELFQHFGFSTFLAAYYPSLIRGGHNFTRMSYSTDTVHADHSLLDLLIAVNEESVRLHTTELNEGGIVIVEEAYYANLRGLVPSLYSLPITRITKELNAPHVAAPSVAIGAFFYIAGLSPEELEQKSALIFADVPHAIEMNVKLAREGYVYARDNGYLKRPEFLEGRGENVRGEILIDGNRAVGKGFLAAGLEFFIGYPMTPASSLLHFMAKESTKNTLRVIHPEDEIASINMALGVSYAGKRVATTSATGGFALMQEAFSFAGISELPLAIMVSQRQGPATGVPTHTGQADLRFVIHSGHGEFPRIVIAPGDAEECFKAGVAALNLAWKYQIPTIVLLDKHISESLSSAVIHSEQVSIERGSIAESPTNSYARYQLTDNGISPMAFPGTHDVEVKATSYEHEESGISTDEDVMVKAMQDKRFKKMDGIKTEFTLHDSVKIYGDTTSDTAIIFWGSTKGAVLEAAKYLSRPVKLIQVIWVEPLDAERLKTELAGITQIIDVEGNHNAQLAGLLREKTGIVVTNTILRYDSETFEARALAAELNQLLS